MATESLDRRIVAALEGAAVDGVLSERLTGDDWTAWETACAERVAAAVGVAPDRVESRLRALRADGVLRGYRPRIDHDALGYSHVAVFRLAVEHGTTDAVCERLRAVDSLIDIYRVTGPNDVVAVGRFRSTDATNQLLRRLHADPDVATVDGDVVIDTLRDHRSPGRSGCE